MLAMQAYKKPATSRQYAERLQARYQFYQLNGLVFLPLTGKNIPASKIKHHVQFTAEVLRTAMERSSCRRYKLRPCFHAVAVSIETFQHLILLWHVSTEECEAYLTPERHIRGKEYFHTDIQACSEYMRCCAIDIRR